MKKNFSFLFIVIQFIYAGDDLGDQPIKQAIGAANVHQSFSPVFKLSIEFISQQLGTITERSYHHVRHRNLEFERGDYHEGVGNVVVHGESYKSIHISGSDEYPDVSGQVYKNNSRIIVTFHGSEWIEDWIQDFRFGMIDARTSFGHRGNVHKGFLTMSQRVFNNFKSSLDELLGETNENKSSFDYIFTGHSLGGSIAILNAALFAQELGSYDEKTNQIKIITFSTPPVGDSYFNERLHQRIAQDNILNFVSTSDLLAHSLYISKNFMTRTSIGIMTNMLMPIWQVLSYIPLIRNYVDTDSTTLSDGYDQTGVIIDVMATDHCIGKFRTGLTYLWNGRRLETNVAVIRRLDEVTGHTFSTAAKTAFVGWSLEQLQNLYFCIVSNPDLASAVVCVEANPGLTAAGVGGATGFVTMSLIKYFTLMHELPTIQVLSDAFIRTLSAYHNPSDSKLPLKDVGRSHLVQIK